MRGWAAIIQRENRAYVLIRINHTSNAWRAGQPANRTALAPRARQRPRRRRRRGFKGRGLERLDFQW